MRAYICQARNLIPSDQSGLSDPFVRVISPTRCMETRVIQATLNPTWDETLEFENLDLNGHPQFFLEEPRLFLVEVYDHDIVVCSSFLH